MRKCVNCGRYTLKQDKCPICGSEVRVPHPPRFSPQDKYVLYRLKAKYGLEVAREGAEEAGEGRPRRADPASAGTG